jgi:hypothetical protein
MSGSTRIATGSGRPLSRPAENLDPYRLAAQTQVINVVAMVAAKVGGEAARERDRQRILSEMTRREFGDHA